MTIEEMHVWFRQYAQQMGLQHTRAILPEQIDILINTSIYDAVNQIIKENLGITSDRIVTDNSKLGQTNALRSLYRVKEIPLLSDSDNQPFNFNGNNNYHYFASSDSIKLQLFEDTPNGTGPVYLFLVDFAINYVQGTGRDSEGNIIKNPEFTTAYYPVRLIDDIYLADVLNDFVLSPRFRSPVLSIYNNNTDTDVSRFDLYLDTRKGFNKYNITPWTFRVSYVAKPATVVYREDVNQESVNCNLPEYMHVDIVKHAVDLYRISISGALNASQQQAQQQQREAVRNAYNNDNSNNQQTN